jgi:2-polyprenyl-3-methyl-5-hydroxy-6-metoxy-1,4-benzoquinol methylase
MAEALPANPDCATVLTFFRGIGATDEDYLVTHFERFRATQREFLGGWGPERGRRLLDVGAHWLHQAAMWAAAGFEVTALDLPETLSQSTVRDAAERLGIRLVTCESLAAAGAMSTLPDDSFDVLLLTEVIEHLAFNPVAMWREIHRVMAPGARLIVTTPNAYRLGGWAWRPLRFVSGHGFGIPVEDIVGLRDRSHHWKEYSRKEIIRYFALLSPDFHICKALHVRTFRRSPGVLRSLIERPLPFLRGNLHIEMDLPSKDVGIVAEPGW